MSDDAKKAGHGGARPGAGRKPVLSEIERLEIGRWCESRQLWLASQALQGAWDGEHDRGLDEKDRDLRARYQIIQLVPLSVISPH